MRVYVGLEVYPVTAESLKINLMWHPNTGLCAISLESNTCGFRDMFFVDLLYVSFAKSVFKLYATFAGILASFGLAWLLRDIAFSRYG